MEENLAGEKIKSKHAREAEVWKFISSLRFQGIGAGGGEEGVMRLTKLCCVFFKMHIVLLKDVTLWPKLASPRWSMRWRNVAREGN